MRPSFLTTVLLRRTVLRSTAASVSNGRELGSNRRKATEGLRATATQQQEQFESKIAHQQKQIEALSAGLQKVRRTA